MLVVRGQPRLSASAPRPAQGRRSTHRVECVSTAGTQVAMPSLRDSEGTRWWQHLKARQAASDPAREGGVEGLGGRKRVEGVAFQVACAGGAWEPGRRPLPGPGPRRTSLWFCEEAGSGDPLEIQSWGVGKPSTFNHVSSGLPAVDINECLSISPTCPVGHTCINTEGSYTCQKNVPNCGRGYHLNDEGTRCVGGF